MHRAGQRWLVWGALIASGCGDDSDGPANLLPEAGLMQPPLAVDASSDALAAAHEASVDADTPHDAAAVLDASQPMDAATPVKDASTLDASRDASAADAGNTDAGAANAESGRLVGITRAHNAVRAMVQTSTPLPPMVWSPTLAAYAQQWADTQAKTACAAPGHRSGTDLEQKGYGENLAVYFGSGTGAGPLSTPEDAVQGWAAEVSCWTFGTLSGLGVQGTEKCNKSCYEAMHSDGCGHYTQVVWRKSIEVGCGVATCNSGRGNEDIWICNYSPGGNFVGQTPY
jgi:uncharacterized protein YkwD